jgi:hypothetical protein
LIRRSVVARGSARIQLCVERCIVILPICAIFHYLVRPDGLSQVLAHPGKFRKWAGAEKVKVVNVLKIMNKKDKIRGLKGTCKAMWEESCVSKLVRPNAQWPHRNGS